MYLLSYDVSIEDENFVVFVSDHFISRIALRELGRRCCEKIYLINLKIT